MPISVNTVLGQQFIEGFMADSCTVTRDISEVQGDVLDQTTGLLSRPTGNVSAVYSGPCLFKHPGRSRDVELGGEPEDLPDYKVLLPLSAQVRLRDILTCTVSADPFLIDRVFRVTDTEGGTFATYRAAYVTDITAAPTGY